MGRYLVISIILGILLMVLMSTIGRDERETHPGSVDDHATLIRLRSSLGLRAKEWPKKFDHCTSWKGIRCRNTQVVGIDISGFRRTRIGNRNPQFSVDALANLTSLESFNASRFSLPGSIPDWFGQLLASLLVLDLSSCSINGTIPSSFGLLTNLSTLSLSNNTLTGRIPSPLGQLSGLSILDFSENFLSGSIPPTFSSLRNLSFLDISSNRLEGAIPPAIGTLSNLGFLNLSTNNFSSSIPPQLGELVNLVDIDLSKNSFSGSLPADFARLRNLQKMTASNNNLRGPLPDSLFSSLPGLRFIILSDNRFNGSIPGALFAIPNLLLLDLSNNNFTGVLPNVSFISSTRSSVLNISGNKLYGALTPVLKRFRFCNLSRNYFQGHVPKFITSNSHLLHDNCLQNVSNQRTLADCRSFYDVRNLGFFDFGPFSAKMKKNKRWIALVAGLGGGGLIFLLVVLALLLFCCCKNGGVTSQRRNGVGSVPTSVNPPSTAAPSGVSINISSLGEPFTYQQLIIASDEFSNTNLIKHGHSGDIVKGLLENGVSIVIKRIDLQAVKLEGYQSELEFFSKAPHPRFVPLLGHCSEHENQKFLVYRYMPNGDLSNSLFKKTHPEDDSLQSLDWITRLKIAIGAAEGLSYLHHECNPPLVHRDIQASSILLDDKFEVRLGSLSNVCTHEGETHQNVISRILRIPQTSEFIGAGLVTTICAYDVFCFGKVLLELVSGQLGISSGSDAATKFRIDEMLPHINMCEKETVTRIVDPSLIIDEDLLEEVWAMAIVARSCLNPKPSKRPPMRHVLKALENPLKVVREDSSSSGRMRTGGSWNASVFGTWGFTSEAAGPREGRESGSLKQSGTTGSPSQGSGGFNGGGSSSQRRHYVFPEPSSSHEVDRLAAGSD